MLSLPKYVLGSLALSSAVIYHSFRTREQFYPAMLYLSSSKLSVVILGNFLFSITLVFGNLLKKVFLGTLREAEVERLQERSKEAIMETCLAMTIFREEFNVNFVALFVSLLFVKIGHWLAQDRVEYVETTPTVTRLNHTRIVTFLALLLVLDGAFLNYSVGYTLANGPSVLLYFGFEYVILASATVSTIVKYIFYAIDMFVDGRWENKGLCVFYLELVTDLLQIFVYLIFFLIIMKYYGFPLHLMRDLYSTIRNFRTRVSDFIRYRRITTNMNERFPEATAEELQRLDTVCIICREEMTSAKKLPCGHLFHAQCLRSWLERQQTCPTCRAPVLPTPPLPATDPPATDPPAPGAPAPGTHAHAPSNNTPSSLDQLQVAAVQSMVEMASAAVASAEAEAQQASSSLALTQQLTAQASDTPGAPGGAGDMQVLEQACLICAQAQVGSAASAHHAVFCAHGVMRAAALQAHPAGEQAARAAQRAEECAHRATNSASRIRLGGGSVAAESTSAAVEAQAAVREALGAARELLEAAARHISPNPWPPQEGGAHRGDARPTFPPAMPPDGVNPAAPPTPGLLNQDPAMANWYAGAPNWNGVPYAGLPVNVGHGSQQAQQAQGMRAPQEQWPGYGGMMPYGGMMAPPMFMPPPMYSPPPTATDVNTAPPPAAGPSSSTSPPSGEVSAEQQQQHHATAAAAATAVAAMFSVSPMNPYMYFPPPVPAPSSTEMQQIFAAVQLLHDRLPALLASIPPGIASPGLCSRPY